MSAAVVEPVGLNANWSDSAIDTGAFKNVGYKNDLTVSFSTSLDSIG